jgi:hypothetical protein
VDFMRATSPGAKPSSERIFLGVLATARRGPCDGTGRARQLDRLADQFLRPVVRRHDVLEDAQVLHLRLLEHALHVVDQAAGDAAVVELLDPVRAVVQASRRLISALRASRFTEREALSWNCGLATHSGAPRIWQKRSQILEPNTAMFM